MRVYGIPKWLGQCSSTVGLGIFIEFSPAGRMHVLVVVYLWQLEAWGRWQRFIHNSASWARIQTSWVALYGKELNTHWPSLDLIPCLCFAEETNFRTHLSFLRQPSTGWSAQAVQELPNLRREQQEPLGLVSYWSSYSSWAWRLRPPKWLNLVPKLPLTRKFNELL